MRRSMRSLCLPVNPAPCSSFFSANFGSVLHVELLTKEGLLGRLQSKGHAKVYMEHASHAQHVLDSCSSDGRLFCRGMIAAGPLLHRHDALM